MLPFRFDDADVSPTLLVDVPSGIKTRAVLFEELARRLMFPDYFGANWDALWDCIRDLSWLPAGPVVLRHRDLPLADDLDDLKKYLSILRDTVEKKWTVRGQCLRDLIVIFPREAREQISLLLRSE